MKRLHKFIDRVFTMLILSRVASLSDTTLYLAATAAIVAVAVIGAFGITQGSPL